MKNKLNYVEMSIWCSIFGIPLSIGFFIISFLYTSNTLAVTISIGFGITANFVLIYYLIRVILKSNLDIQKNYTTISEKEEMITNLMRGYSECKDKIVNISDIIIHPVFKKTNTALGTIYKTYLDFNASLIEITELAQSQEAESILTEKEVLKYAETLSRILQDVIDETVVVLDRMLNMYFQSRRIHEPTSICFKMLETPIDRINGFYSIYTIYRDKISYDKGRKVNKIQYCTNNTVYALCINSSNGIFICNDATAAFKDNHFVLAPGQDLSYYNSFAIIAVKDIITNKCYGFICIDSWNANSIPDLFILNDLKSIVNPLINLLSTVFTCLDANTMDIDFYNILEGTKTRGATCEA